METDSMCIVFFVCGYDINSQSIHVNDLLGLLHLAIKQWQQYIIAPVPVKQPSVVLMV